jgi:hypothetical protein
MGVGLVDKVMHMADIVGMINAEVAKVPMLRGPYKKKAAEISN